MLYIIVWDNGHSCGTLSGRYTNKRDAERDARAWKREIVAIDSDPREARQVYSWEIVPAKDGD